MTKKLKLDFHVLLPQAPDEQDACVRRLIDSLEGKQGIEKVHVEKSQASDEAVLCIHYDADGISLSRVEQIAKAEGAILTERFGHTLLTTQSPRHARHADLIKQKIASIDGVLSVGVSLNGKIRVEFDQHRTDAEKISAAIEEQGVRLSDERDSHHDHRHDHDHKHDHNHDQNHNHSHGSFGLGERAELLFAATAAVTLTIGYAVQSSEATSAWIPRALFIASAFFGGFFTTTEAFENLRKKRFEIDTLMLVAAVGAAFLGKWAEGALLLTLFSLGHALEHYAMGRAKRAIEALADLAPKTAHVFRDGRFIDLPVAELKVGDRVLIKPNERIPVDGIIVKGSGSVNQAPVTGESVPVDKTATDDPKAEPETFRQAKNENKVFTGTINGASAFEVAVLKLSSESTLARIVKLVAEAQAEASPTEQFTKKLEKYFVPGILIGVAFLLFAFLVVDESFGDSFYRAMAVLVAASPCALAISTPSAVLSGIARAGRSGVLIKSGAALENLGRLTAVAFDKTGTLTEGKPVVTDVALLDNTTESELLRLAASVEKTSDHPLARSVVHRAEQAGLDLPAVSNVVSITGKGIKATVGGETVHVGKSDLFDGGKNRSALSSSVQQLQDQGRTVIVVGTSEKALGVFGVMDKPRESSKRALSMLLETGLEKLIMLSGDHQKVADAVAKEIGLTDAFGDLMPDDKVKAIKDLREKYGMVAMVGDGVNDAPAMAAATVGIAMGAAGSDVALETADIALMTEDLNRLVFSIRLSRQARRIIKQNLWVSLGMVALLIPATVFGLGIGPAVAAHEGSTLVVVFNALRLLLYRD